MSYPPNPIPSQFGDLHLEKVTDDELRAALAENSERSRSQFTEAFGGESLANTVMQNRINSYRQSHNLPKL